MATCKFHECDNNMVVILTRTVMVTQIQTVLLKVSSDGNVTIKITYVVGG